mmetsp:Transcript_67994/g.107839  ORF Transcript_67994/g.107839 Transcript_67994/m.107839 type:complete len:234 (-) Transcript_67994:170-871(-)
MYQLRAHGANHYSFNAGSRSDFILVNHPEFVLGRVGSEAGLGKGWDSTKFKTSDNPTYKSAPMRVMRQSLKARDAELRGLQPRKPPLKERALARCRSDSEIGKREPDSLDGFISALMEPGAIPTVYRNPHNLQSLGHSTKHYMDKRSQLVDLRVALQRDSEATKQKLAEGDLWKYHALSMQQVKQRGAQAKREEDGPQKEYWTKPVGHGRWNYKAPPPPPLTKFSTKPLAQER